MAEGDKEPRSPRQQASSSNAPAPSPANTIRPPRQTPTSPLSFSGLNTQFPNTPARASLRGRARGASAEFRIPGNSQPATPMSPDPPSMAIPGRGALLADEDDDDDVQATPRTSSYFPQQGEARRLSEVRSGMHTPHGQGGSGIERSLSPVGSGFAGAQNMGSGGSGRGQRPRLAVTGTGSVSRSGSRVRLPLAAKDKEQQEDDELRVIDRGEELVRRRLKERKRAKRERERLLAEAAEEEGDDDGASAPPTAATDAPPPPAVRNAGISPARNLAGPSRHRATSASRVTSGSTFLPSTRPESVINVDRPESIRSEYLGNDDDDAHPELDSEHGDEDDHDEDEDANSDEVSPDDGEEGVTVKDRQDAINIEHPFGLPIWKPALYRKSRSVTRNAESALHSIPSAAAGRNLLLGNVFWLLVFGLPLGAACLIAALLVTGAEAVVGGRGGYGETLRGLAWYIVWPFGKYVEGEGAPDVDSSHDGDERRDEEQGGSASGDTPQRALSSSTSSSGTVRAYHTFQPLETLPDEPSTPHADSRGRPGVSFTGVKSTTPSTAGERVPLLGKPPGTANCRKHVNRRAKLLGSIIYWPVFLLVVAPTMLFVCIVCWFLVITVPMAKLTWELLLLLWNRPLEIGFRRAPKIPVLSEPNGATDANGKAREDSQDSRYVLKRARLHAGQVAPTAGPTSTVLLCTYRAVGLQYYKYTVGGVNIMFVNLMPLVFFAIFDGMFLLPMVEDAHKHGKHVSKIMQMITNQGFIFLLGLASVIPLSYFIGMAVASISAQSSIGMGAVINATFGSIIEIVLYSIALTQGKGRLVEGSVVGSLLAGVLLMPGASMCSGALKRKEQKFNAKSAGVTSTMLIMAIIGTLTPTMFYQTYGSFQIHCKGCPRPYIQGSMIDPKDSWRCDRCYYDHPEPTSDPFYQEKVKTLMYCCAAILLLSYLIGLWFSLRTHASQIWQNPQQVMAKDELPPLHRAHLARITPSTVMNPILPVHSKPASIRDGVSPYRRTEVSPYRDACQRNGQGVSPLRTNQPLVSPKPQRKELDDCQQQQYDVHSGYTPYLQSLDPKTGMESMNLSAPLTQEDFHRAVHTLATVSALHRARAGKPEEKPNEGHGGHEAPSWTRGVSAAVLLSCTVLYALIAEVLVDVVDVIMSGSGLDEKFLGLTLFALVPNTTEFMNAMSFAMNGNIALSMEIGSAYALQVCLLQIPAMVAFSAFYDPKRLGDQVDTFTLIFPRWDVIAIILSIFLLTYTYIEARSNYHRGSILVLAYIVLLMGFYFAPVRTGDEDVIVGGPIAWAQNVGGAMSLAVTRLWV